MTATSLGICGLGLIGSSIARAWVDRGPVLALDPDPEVLRRAAAVGISPVSSLSALCEVDLVVLAAPTAANIELLDELMDGQCRPPTMDAGSVKTPILNVWRDKDPNYPFVATHPMAGSELAGFEAGHAGLFDDASWPVVVAEETDAAALMLTIGVVLQLGARPIPVSATAHDRVVADISHLPHLLAGALGQVTALSDSEQLSVLLAAGSFRDVSRVSGSPSQRTAGIISANRTNAADSARMAARLLEQAADLLLAGDESDLIDWLSVGERVRADFAARSDQDSSAQPNRAGWSISELSDEAAKEALLDVRDSGSSVVDVRHSGTGLTLFLSGGSRSLPGGSRSFPDGGESLPGGSESPTGASGSVSNV